MSMRDELAAELDAMDVDLEVVLTTRLVLRCRVCGTMWAARRFPGDLREWRCCTGREDDEE